MLFPKRGAGCSAEIGWPTEKGMQGGARHGDWRLVAVLTKMREKGGRGDWARSRRKQKPSKGHTQVVQNMATAWGGS